MVSYAGFYVTPEDWTDWVRLRYPPGPPPGVVDAEFLIERALHEQGVQKYFVITTVPTPPSESEECDNARMVYQLHSEKRKYMAPRARVDSHGTETMQRLIGLKVSEWRTHWHNENSGDPPYEAEFLKPKPTKNIKRLDGTRSEKEKKGTKTKKKVNNDKETQAQVWFTDEVQEEWEPSGLPES